ncbi:hypothetical protein CEK25_013084 [Fusarium fujikuroi]|nr:hypothetical protein CEK25_013084 [Fusarium fujikuroi]
MFEQQQIGSITAPEPSPNDPVQAGATSAIPIPNENLGVACHKTPPVSVETLAKSIVTPKNVLCHSTFDPVVKKGNMFGCPHLEVIPLDISRASTRLLLSKATNRHVRDLEQRSNVLCIGIFAAIVFIEKDVWRNALLGLMWFLM